jgi:hypothetical protein
MRKLIWLILCAGLAEACKDNPNPGFCEQGTGGCKLGYRCDDGDGPTRGQCVAVTLGVDAGTGGQVGDGGDAKGGGTGGTGGATDDAAAVEGGDGGGNTTDVTPPLDEGGPMCAMDGECSGGTICVGMRCSAPRCGDGRKTAAELCDDGNANAVGGYGQKGKCTTECKPAPYCGDGAKNGAEACDDMSSGRTDLGSCNAECTGTYEKKLIKKTGETYSSNLGGPSGADSICQKEFGSAWKAMVVGGNRVATKTPFKGDGQNWVIQKYTHYFNDSGQLLWRTDDIALLGVKDGKRVNVYANAYDSGSGNYPWSGWNDDWTTVQASSEHGSGTCKGWTSEVFGNFPDLDSGYFAKPDLTPAATEPCGTKGPLLCVEQ